MAKDKKLHIVMLPWLAFGHINPYLELAKLIAERGHLVSFLSSPRNIDRLPKLPPHLSPLIKFVKFPLPQVPNLPHNAEATTDIPYSLVPFLQKAYDGLREPIAQFLESSNPDWILYDFEASWAPSIASKFGVKSAFFSIFTAPLLGFFGMPLGSSPDQARKTPEDYTVPPPWVPFPTTVAFRYFEIMRMANVFFPKESANDSPPNTYDSSPPNFDLVLVRSCYEFEGEWIELLQTYYNKPVLPVGQLPRTTFDDGDENDDTWLPMKDWLDKQSKGSVVYVAFGSEAKPSKEELKDIALGLEKSELPFIWVLKLQRGPADPEVLQLPEGFEERTRSRGIVCTSWAPQLKILAHESVGGFLSHSGWTSVVEAIQNEKPLVLLTFMADQGVNARVLEEKKMGYPIPRNDRDGSFTSQSVAESLKLLMVEEDGKIYREKIKEMKDIFINRERQEKYVDTLLSYLKDHTNE